MAKIGTAHIELKPVLDERALAVLEERIESAVIAAVQRGVSRGIEQRPLTEAELEARGIDKVHSVRCGIDHLQGPCR